MRLAKGDEGCYHESGTVARVKVLEPTERDDFKGYKLEALGVLQLSSLCPLEVGDIWECETKTGAEIYSAWYLFPAGHCQQPAPARAGARR